MSVLEKRITEDAHEAARVQLENELGKLKSAIGRLTDNDTDANQAVHSLIRAIHDTVYTIVLDKAAARAIEDFYNRVMNSLY